MKKKDSLFDVIYLADSLQGTVKRQFVVFKCSLNVESRNSFSG